MELVIGRGMRGGLLLLLLMVGMVTAEERLRVVVMTDITNEPDDTMSLVRFLTYADVFEVEGLIATTSCWKKDKPHVAEIHQVIDAYEKVQPNLRLHSQDYPSADYLRRVTKAGVDGYGMGVVEGQLGNEGVAHIVAVLEKDDPRPVWFLAWGGANTLGAAGSELILDATGSFDPDGNALAYEWWCYPEPGSYRGEVQLDGGESERVTVRVPADGGGTALHVILTVRDDGAPRLCGYRRVVVSVR